MWSKYPDFFFAFSLYYKTTCTCLNFYLFIIERQCSLGKSTLHCTHGDDLTNQVYDYKFNISFAIGKRRRMGPLPYRFTLHSGNVNEENFAIQRLLMKPVNELFQTNLMNESETICDTKVIILFYINTFVLIINALVLLLMMAAIVCGRNIQIYFHCLIKGLNPIRTLFVCYRRSVWSWKKYHTSGC